MPGREDEFNLWYDPTHLPDVLKLPGFVSARQAMDFSDFSVMSWVALGDR
jgi:hypothetical protein